MPVQDPSKDDDIDAIFNRARQLQAVERPIDSSLHFSSSSRSFTGTERFLSAFLESIRNSKWPKELGLAEWDTHVHVVLVRKDENCPESEKQQVPSQGIGRTLGYNSNAGKLGALYGATRRENLETVSFRSPAARSRSSATNFSSSLRISEIISEADLKSFINYLNEEGNENEKWDNVIDKRNSLLSYKAKCCKPKDGPIKYLSWTVFENCSPDILRDFYMDNDFRKQWDKTFVEYEQLHLDETGGIEIGRIVKKFPLLRPREYILAWRVWEGNNKIFYCIVKECEHPLAPRQRKYVRVGIFRSAWRIRKVPGRNACEIKMVHQEDASLNMNIAKLAFAKGIWSYICEMDNAMRKYSSVSYPSSLGKTAITFTQKIPLELKPLKPEAVSGMPATSTSASSSASEANGGCSSVSMPTRKPLKKLIANGLLIVGGLVFLSHGHSLGAKVAIALILKRLSKHVSK
ncbi:hypothetical protein Nepgr_017917 [Nepenthes gracilis]|uniref:START domain-containing protein n=1 Tax=Nepenthes gracilis TaxID=150966 RepID=A0AAD3SSV9_NEPGR|nr:hypothetical protein Nepgr_017917 [Nepenthes gracilis]